MMSVGSYFLCEHSHEADPLVHLSLAPRLHVDVINGWPLIPYAVFWSLLIDPFTISQCDSVFECLQLMSSVLF